MTKEDLLVLLCASIHDENRMILKILSSLTSPESQKLLDNTISIMDNQITGAINGVYKRDDVKIDKYTS